MTYPFYDFASRESIADFSIAADLSTSMRRGYFLLQRGAYAAVCISGLRGYLNSRVA